MHSPLIVIFNCRLAHFLNPWIGLEQGPCNEHMVKLCVVDKSPLVERCGLTHLHFSVVYILLWNVDTLETLGCISPAKLYCCANTILHSPLIVIFNFWDWNQYVAVPKMLNDTDTNNFSGTKFSNTTNKMKKCHTLVGRRTL